MRKTSHLIFFLLLISPLSFSQTRAITDDGDTIMVYENGTWEPIKKEISPMIPSLGTVKTSIEIDKVTNQKIISTEQWRYLAVDSKSMSITGSMYKKNGIYIISLVYSGDLGCLAKDESSLKIKLSSGYIIECAQISKNECGRIQRGDFVVLSLEQSKQPTIKL